MNSGSVTSPSPRQKSSARLHAVQAVYNMVMTGVDARTAVNAFFEQKGPIEPELADLTPPAADLFISIVSGVERTRGTLDDVLSNHLKEGYTVAGMAEKEPLLLAILLCGTYELVSHHEIDPPLIISDYIDVTHSYYQGQESRIINGILDSIRPLFRTK